MKVSEWTHEASETIERQAAHICDLHETLRHIRDLTENQKSPLLELIHQAAKKALK